MAKAIEELFSLSPPSLLRTAQPNQPSASQTRPSNTPPPPIQIADVDEESDIDDLEGDMGNESDVSLLSGYDEVDSDHDDDEWEMMDTAAGGVHHEARPPTRHETHPQEAVTPVRLETTREHWAIQRSETTNTSTTPRRATSGGSKVIEEPPLTATVMLSRSFSNLLRIAVSLITSPEEVKEAHLKVGQFDPSFIWEQIHDIVQWLMDIMDSTEKQLRLGNAVGLLVKGPPNTTAGKVSATQASASSAVNNDHLTLLSLAYRHSVLTTVDPALAAAQNDARKECLTYLNSLMRWAKDEHGGCLPSVDIKQMKHIALILETVLYLLYNIPSRPDTAENDIDEGVSSLREPISSFFRRTQSLTCLSVLPISPFEPIAKAVPLADRPQLLQPSVNKREILRGSQLTMEVWPPCSIKPNPLLSRLVHPLCERGVSKMEPLPPESIIGLTQGHLASGVMLGRWNTCIELFVKVFGQSFVSLSSSLFSDYGCYKEREKRFRKNMEVLRMSGGTPFVLEVNYRGSLKLGHTHTNIHKWVNKIS